MRSKPLLWLACLVSLSLFLPWSSAQKKQPAEIPHGQDSPPGPPLPPAEAIKKMKVPEGFSVELVASEPNLVNPVAMTFDERGRIWITESLEYPRHAAGPGRDRVKVFESTRGDGVYDKVTVFAEGLNIPSGIAVGHGGVWVANAPDILFYKEGPDGKAAGKPEVVVTGVGRHDTHELPNSLTWGPDGWLYGLNGVFNPSVVKQNGKEFRFTCALFRIHPKTREFQIFCEGTSNPWGVAWDNDGSAFVSACVIDHLWHLVETGYYHRQGGPYPPYTWILGSIVKHRHQKAAYCGIHFFDSDAYPPEYREKLYMGNIHGGCVNSDELTRDGATYFGKPRPDFLTANDKWFMPVVQKTGPDGCLYILDWYDRYHCYQDAGRDPAGIDREHGRLYRVRYKNTPRAGKFDLAKETDDQLIQRLHSPNVLFRDLAQRLLCERSTPEIRAKLGKLVLDEAAPRKARMHALWSLIGSDKLETAVHLQLLASKEAGLRAWAVRAAGNQRTVDAAVRDKVAALADDPSPDVKLQVVIAARKIEGLDAMSLFTRVLSNSGEDKTIPAIVWQNLHPLLEEHGTQFARTLKKKPLPAGVAALVMPRILDRLLSTKKPDAGVICELLAALMDDPANPAAARQALASCAGKVQSGEVSEPMCTALRDGLLSVLGPIVKGKADQPCYCEAVILGTALKDAASIEAARRMFQDPSVEPRLAARSLDALIAAGDSKVLDMVEPRLRGRGEMPAQVLASLGRLSDPRVADIVLSNLSALSDNDQGRAFDLLTQRPSWAKKLLMFMIDNKIPPTRLNIGHVRKMLASKDPDLVKKVTAVWGSVREERNPQREKVVAEMRTLLRKTPGDPKAGVEVFKKLCGQCHKIHGEGQEVGPDITLNGRSDFEQLLSNVFDPSLVIGAGYAATTVTTKQGLTITGLVVEDTPQRIVLKQQGGKIETIPRKNVEDVTVSKISLMPEDVEKQLKPQEIADLFAFLCLDKPPNDPTAKRIPGTPNPKK
jgi:putative heme-binding domain-containing protein